MIINRKEIEIKALFIVYLNGELKIAQPIPEGTPFSSVDDICYFFGDKHKVCKLLRAMNDECEFVSDKDIDEFMNICALSNNPILESAFRSSTFDTFMNGTIDNFLHNVIHIHPLDVFLKNCISYDTDWKYYIHIDADDSVRWGWTTLVESDDEILNSIKSIQLRVRKGNCWECEYSYFDIWNNDAQCQKKIKDQLIDFGSNIEKNCEKCERKRAEFAKFWSNYEEDI